MHFLTKDSPAEAIMLRLPAENRIENEGPIIAQSLHMYFNKRMIHQGLLVRKKRGSSLMLMIGGIIIMVLGPVITYNIADSMLSSFLRIIIEPAGWFMLWTGLDIFFYEL